jgi:UTP--glucose-1-phosphate uridylyltransferase
MKTFSIPLLVPAAGLGSRLFPATWGIPKELFPLGSKPALHYLLEEALCAGIHKTICVTSPRKEALLTYLSYTEDTNKVALTSDEKRRLVLLDSLNTQMNYSFVTQKIAQGVGDAMLCAYDQLKEHDFFCMAYPDDVLLYEYSGLSQLIKIHKTHNCSVIAIEKVLAERIHAYGVIGYNDMVENDVFDITKIVEKPLREEAPSLFGIVGRYLISKEILDIMKRSEKKCFITALNNFIQQGHKIYGAVLNGPRYDIGTVSGWVEAVNAFHNKHNKNIIDPHVRSDLLRL